MKIAFYKGKSEIPFFQFLNILIYIWTWGTYTHVEVIDDRAGKDDTEKWNWYSASGLTEGVVRMKNITYIPDHWDIFDVDQIDTNRAVTYIESQSGKKYDWIGILFNQFLPLRLHSKDKWFCSEIVTKSLQVASPYCQELKPYNTSPIRLYKYLQELDIINEGNKWN